MCSSDLTIVQKINQKHAVFALLIGIYSSMVFSFNYAGLKSFDLSSESRIAAEILKIEQSFNGYGVQWALIALALALFFYLFFEWRVKTGQRVKAGLSCISVVFGFFNSIDEDSPLRRPSSDKPYFDEAESLEVHEHVTMLLDE